MRLLLAALVACMLFPVASAETLASFQEPHTGADQVWDFTLDNDDAYVPHVVLFMNPVRSPSFEISVYAENGTKIFDHKGARGVQTLQALEPGHYRFGVTGAGTFLATRHFLDAHPEHTRVNGTLTSTNVTTTDVSRVLEAPTEAWLLVPQQSWHVHVTGNVSVEWSSFNAADLASSAKHLTTPVNETAVYPFPVVLLLRGQPGARYEIHMDPAPEVPSGAPTQAAKTPGPASATLACAGVIAAVALRRVRPKA